MKKLIIKWNENGWTRMQDGDPAKHQMEINCRAENGTVVEVRIRHSRGEEQKGIVTVAGKEILPLPLEEFKALYKKDALEFR